MQPDNSFRDFVLDQLAGVPELICNWMFGGYGLYSGETFFAIIAGGRFYLWTSEETRRRFVAREMQPFRPSARQTITSYYEVPLDVLEDIHELKQWALEAIRLRNEHKINR